MSFVEIYPNNKNGRKYREDEFNEVADYSNNAIWYDKENELVVILNTETDVAAVYERLGDLYCMHERFGLYEFVDVDREDLGERNEEIRLILKQEALDAGFPEKLPKTTKKYDVDINTFVCQALRIEAENADEASDIAHELLRNDELVRKYISSNFINLILSGDYERHVNATWDVGVWDGDVIEVDASDVAKLVEEQNETTIGEQLLYDAKVK